MILPDALGWLVLLIGALGASTIGGVAGFGTGVIMLPVIASVMGVKATVPILTVAMLIGNLARVWFSRGDVDVRVVGAFLVGAVPTAIVGAMLYSRIEAEWISRMLGAFMLASVPLRRVLEARGVSIRLAHFPIIGGVFGGLSSLVGSVGAVMTPFFLGYGLRRGGYLATDALCTVGMYVPRGLVFQGYGLMTAPVLSVGIAIGLFMVGGAWLGRHLLDRMSEALFLRMIESLLVVFGVIFLVMPSS